MTKMTKKEIALTLAMKKQKNAGISKKRGTNKQPTVIQKAFANSIERTRTPAGQWGHIDALLQEIESNPRLVHPKLIQKYLRGYPGILTEILDSGRIDVKSFEAAFESLPNIDAWKVLDSIPESWKRETRTYHMQQIKTKPTQKCENMHATVFALYAGYTGLRQRTSSLPSTRIRRKKVVNAVEGVRYHAPLELTITTMSKMPALTLWQLQTHPIATCKFINDITFEGGNIILVQDATGYIVGAASFNISDKNTLYVKYLCSARQCKGAGTAVIRGLEVYANRRGCTYIELSSVPNAIPFYIRTGFNSMQWNSNREEFFDKIQNGPPVFTNSNGTNTLNFTKVRGYMRKKVY